MSSIITGREVTATMSSNRINRFKVVYHLGTGYKPKKFWFSVRPEENIQTISDFKVVLAEMFRLSPNFKLDIYLDGFALLDWTQLTTIKDNETIEVRSGQPSQEDDKRFA